MEKYILKNLDCADCAAKLESNISKIKEVKSVSIHFATMTMFLDTKDIQKVKEQIKKINPKVEIIKSEEIRSDIESDLELKKMNKEKILIIISLILFVIGFFTEKILEYKLKIAFDLSLFYNPLYIISYLIIGTPIVIGAFNAIKNKNYFDEKVLMTVSTIAAFFIGAFEEACGVMLFYTIGEYFQNISVIKSRRTIKKLMELKVSTVNLFELGTNKTREEDISKVKINDYILVKVGEKIPLDGVIIEGSSDIDTATITGESMPRFFDVGDDVLAGMINLSNTLIIKINKKYEDSSLFKIIEMVENSVHKKAKIEKFITNFSKWYTPTVIILALLVGIVPLIFFQKVDVSSAIYNAIVLLVISCPCALVLSIPLTFFSGIGASAREGILVKGSNIFDGVDKVKTVFLDKTGTITEGNFSVSKVNVDLKRVNMSVDKIYEYIYAIEKNSNHPIAKSIVEFIKCKYHLTKYIQFSQNYEEYLEFCKHCGCCHDSYDHLENKVIFINKMSHEIGHNENDKCKNHKFKISEEDIQDNIGTHEHESCCSGHEKEEHEHEHESCCSGHKKEEHEHGHESCCTDHKDENKHSHFGDNIIINSQIEKAGMGIKALIDDSYITIGNLKMLEEENIKISDEAYSFEKLTGTVIHVAYMKEYVMSILIKDKIKEDSKKAVEMMRKNGVEEIIMLTGDNESTAKEVKEKILIDKYYSNLLPEDKLTIVENKIKELENDKNHKVMYIGDGINDAPVIALSDVGVAMGKLGSDIAIETADVVFNNDSLMNVSILKKLSKKLKWIVYENLAIILTVKFLIIIAGALGKATMWGAVFGDVGVTIIAVLNSMRVLKKDKKTK